MNEMQKKVLLSMGTIVLGMLLWPPYTILDYRGHVDSTGYGWIFDLPNRATLNISTLVIQWIGILIVGSIAYFYFTDWKNNSKMKEKDQKNIENNSIIEKKTIGKTSP